MPNKNKNNSPRQDDTGEKQLLKMFDKVIKPVSRSDENPDGKPDRSASGPPDGRVIENDDPVELKACTKQCKSVSTGRRFWMRDVERYRSRHFIFGFGPKEPSGDINFGELRYGHPGVSPLKEWFDEQAHYFEVWSQQYTRATALLQEAGQSQEELRVWADGQHLTRNDPNILYNVIRQLPRLPLDGDYQTEFLRLVTEHPQLPPAPVFERREGRAKLAYAANPNLCGGCCCPLPYEKRRNKFCGCVCAARGRSLAQS